MMSRLMSLDIVTAVVVAGIMILPAPAAAETDTDRESVKRVTTICRAQVKLQAQFHKMSLYARHEAVKNCIKEGLAKP